MLYVFVQAFIYRSRMKEAKEAGYRVYIKKNLAQKLEAEAEDLGISIDELIIAKLSATNRDRAIENVEARTIKLESILLELVELMATNKENKNMRVLP